MTATPEELALAVDTTEWEWLRAHLERNGLILVAQDLDLVEAGCNVANDDTVSIEQWIASGKLAKPSASQITAWDGTPGKRFQMLIISPYVLIQEEPAIMQ